MDHAARLEFIVEPFVLNNPGPHVQATVDVATQAGLTPDMGPLATTATGELDTVIETVANLLRAGFDQGASSIQLRVTTGEATPATGLHGALEHMVADVERLVGVAMSEMDRSQKQEAVNHLDTRGAFLLRGSVEEVASIMNVSKVTLYAYLNAVGKE